MYKVGVVMFNVIISNKDEPVIYWDLKRKVFGVIDTETVPSEIMDHLWICRDSDTNPKSREEHNLRVVSKWLSTKSGRPPLQLQSLLRSVADTDVGLIELLSMNLKDGWGMSMSNASPPTNIVYY